jgi:hypothetical protein
MAEGALYDTLLYTLTGAVVVLAVCTIVLAGRIGRLRRALHTVGAERAAGQLASHEEALVGLRAEVERMRASLRDLTEQLAGSVQRVGVVRFDAFEDIGGQISFTVALLNAHGDGVVLSVLNGRETARAYAKAVRNGSSSHALSDEERQAIAAAMRVSA